jgi:hypothetical protein
MRKPNQIPNTSPQNGNPLPPLLPAVLILIPMPDLREETLNLQQFLVSVGFRRFDVEARAWDV